MSARIGLGAAYGLPAKSVERAHDRGVRFFLWGALRTASFGAGLRVIARRHRDAIAIGIQSYTRSPLWLRLSVESALRRLRVDHVDSLCLADWDEVPPESLRNMALELRERGRIRELVISSHRRATFADLASLRAPPDAFMVRYNAGHRRAEDEVFSLPNRPKIIAYTATRWGTLLRDTYSPVGARPLTAAECYRFVLARPEVDLCLAGPASDDELDAALEALDRGPLDDDDLARARLVGDAAAAHGRARPPPGPRDFIASAPALARDLVRHGVTEDLLSRFNR